MSKIPDREIKLEWVRHEIEIKKLFANWWIARATTGETLQREVYHGCAKTPEYPEGIKPLTDAEKIKDALDTAETHIHQCRILGDMLMSLLNDNPAGYESSRDRLYR